MKIAIACHNRVNISEHTGRCRRFWVYDISDNKVTDKQLLELTKEQTFHESHGVSPHPLDGISALISRGMGMGLFKRLNAKGIEVIITDEMSPEEALAKYLEGALVSGQPHEGHCKH